MKKTILLFIFLTVSYNSSSQVVNSWEDELDRIGQYEDIDNGSLELMYDNLSDIANNKIDINSCSREQLEQLPFLDDQQIMDIMEYRDRVRRMETAMEFYLIPSLDRETIQILRQFVTFSPEASGDTIPSMRKVLKFGKHTLLADLNIPFYKREGDKNGYLGYQYKHWLRYNFNYGQRVKFGFVASQDAGEPFFAGDNKKGYDFYSLFLMVKDIKPVKALVIGRYRLRFGMGLILNNGYGFGKLATMSSLITSSSHIMAHSSRSEGNYLQGIAGTVTLLKGLDLTAFASYRKIDATLSDSNRIATIITSGYHRTEEEMKKRHNASETLLGGNLNYFRNGFHAGVTGYYTSFSKALNMDNGQLYRRWYPVGKSFHSFSVDYGYLSNKLNISGETAIDVNNYVATINTVSYEFSSRLTLSALQRYYPYQYYAVYAKSVAEGGQVNDESGIFVGGKYKPFRDLTVTFYTDISYFAWPKYRANGASHRWDNFLQFDVVKSKWNFLARYRVKKKEIDNKKKTALTERYEHRGKVSLSYNERAFLLRTQGDFSYTDDESNSFGYMLSETCQWQIRWLRLRGGVGYFNTDDYNSRVYGMEPGLLYTFSFPSFYGHGMRYTLCLRADVSKSLLLVAKTGMTHYFDRSVISSGLAAINSSSKVDMEIQVRWKF